MMNWNMTEENIEAEHTIPDIIYTHCTFDHDYVEQQEP